MGDPQFKGKNAWFWRSVLQEVYTLDGHSRVFRQGDLEDAAVLRTAPEILKTIVDAKTFVRAMNNRNGFKAEAVTGNPGMVQLRVGKGFNAGSYIYDFRGPEDIWAGKSPRTMAPLLDSVAMFGSTPGDRSVLTEGLHGTFSPSQTLQLAMKLLVLTTKGASDFEKSAALGRVMGLGFSTCVGRNELVTLEMEDTGGAEQVYNLRRYLRGLVTIRRMGGKLYAYAAGNSMPYPRPNMSNIVTWLNQDTVDGCWWRLDPKADKVVAVPEKDLLSGNNPYGAKLVDSDRLHMNATVECRVSNAKHLSATAMGETCAEKTIRGVVTAKLPDCQGAILTDHGVLNDLEFERRHEIVKVYTFDRKDEDLATDLVETIQRGSWPMDGWNPNAAPGKEIKPGTEIAVFGDHALTWEGRGAKSGVVDVRDVESYKTATSVTVEVFAFVWAKYVGAAKPRATMKGVLQSAKAADATIAVNGLPFAGMLIADGLIKNGAMAESNMVRIGKMTLVYTQLIEPESVETFKSKLLPGWESNFSFVEQADGNVLMTLTDPDAEVYDVTFLVEAPAVQEAVGSGGMTIPQLAYLASTEAGHALLKDVLMGYAKKKLGRLAYLAMAGTFGTGKDDPLYGRGYAPTEAIKLTLGDDAIDGASVDTNARRHPLLTELAEFHRALRKGKEDQIDGWEIIGSRVDEDTKAVSTTRTWFRPDLILETIGEDGHGSQLADLAYSLAHCMIDRKRAESVDTFGLVWKFRAVCNRLANSRSMQRVYGKRWGVTAKVVPSLAQPRGTFSVNANGAVAEDMAEFARLESTSDLRHSHHYMVRYPAAVGKVMQCTFGPNVGHHVIQVNAFEWPEIHGGDFDGDTGVFFFLPKGVALQLIQELGRLVPKADIIKSAFGIPANAVAVGLSGKPVEEDLTVESMLSKRTRKKVSAWLKADVGAVEAQTRATGQAYKLMESALIAYSLGLTVDLRAALVGAFLYEHRGLAAKLLDYCTKEFLQKWASVALTNEYLAGQAMELLLADVRSIGVKSLDLPGQPAKSLRDDLMVTSLLNKLMNGNLSDERLEKTEADLGDRLPVIERVLPIYEAIFRMSRRQLVGEDGIEALSRAASTEVQQTAKDLQLTGHLLYELMDMTAGVMAEVHDECGGFKAHGSTSAADDDNDDDSWV